MGQPLTIASALSLATARLVGKESETARLDATILLSHVLGIRREMLLFHGDDIVQEQYVDRFDALVERRVSGEPIAYIIGKKEFWSLDFYVTRDTLIPRPDSETLIEAALKRVNNRAGRISILDIGTGTGCLLIALLKELPRASGIGVDINERALLVAQKNAELHGVHDRCRFLKSHWCDALEGTTDLIISNPPYISENDRATLMPDVVQFEPPAALFAGADGLDAYRALAPQMRSRLNDGGFLVWEVGQGQAGAVMQLLRDEGFVTEPPEKDLAGILRCVIARKTH